MQIETKYNIGDTVYRVHGDVKHSIVRSIRVKVEVNYSTIMYYLQSCDDVEESKLYSTKEEAALAWLKSQGLDCGLQNV